MGETNNYRTFLKLSEELIEANERICHLRPVQEIGDQTALEDLKKKLLEIFRKRFRRKWIES